MAMSYCRNRHSPFTVPERYSAGSLISLSLLMVPIVLLSLRWMVSEVDCEYPASDTLSTAFLACAGTVVLKTMDQVPSWEEA